MDDTTRQVEELLARIQALPEAERDTMLFLLEAWEQLRSRKSRDRPTRVTILAELREALDELEAPYQ